MHDSARAALRVCLWLTDAIAQTRSVMEIYDAALEALHRGLGVDRSSILLFDSDGVMRFKAWRGISLTYRQAVEGHTPWTPDTPNPQPVIVADVTREPSLEALQAVFRAEGIASLAFFPLVSQGRVIGKFMLYRDAPHELSADDQAFARLIASQIAFAVERMRASENARASEERLRIALDAAKMGTWEWDLATGSVHVSEAVERIHGLGPGAFSHQIASYQRGIHPEDRQMVIAAAKRAVDEDAAHDVEYRVVAPDGRVEWIESTGRVQLDDRGQPVRMLGVCMNITERKQAELERLDAARETSRLKDEFLAVLSHELRTPLNAIVGWLRLLQSGALDAARAADAIAIIDRNAALQVQLIDQMLDVSRIITGKLQIDRVPMMLSQAIEHAVSTIQPAALVKRIRLVTDVPPALPLIEGDPERLQQIFGNLLSNAVKFTPAGGEVRLRCRASEGTVTIDVHDTGAGIPPEFLPMIFQRFRQADASTTRPHGGLGLGLAISRHLAELHGGTIHATSGGKGRGSTFTLTLPVTRLLVQPQPPAHDSAGLAGVHGNVALAGARVLVVDDEPDARELLKALFTGQGSIVGEAGSTAEALERLRGDEFDLLIADLAMPAADGYALIQTVRRSGRELGAIAVTAFARPQDRARALQAGFDAFHAKPFDPSALLKDASGLRRRDYASGV